MKVAYDVGRVRGWSLVYAGTTRVYQVVCDRGAERSRFAVKLVPARSAEDVRVRALEHRLLQALRPRFRYLPVLVRPVRSCGPAIRYAWGLLSADTAVAVYRWIDCKPFNSGQRHRTQAAQRLMQLTQALADPKLPVGGLAPAANRLFTWGGGVVRYHPRFSFAPFQTSRDASTRKTLSFLEDELQAVKVELREMRNGLASLPVGLVHGEGTPCNCGFDDQGEVKVVFDLDSVRPGLAVESMACTLATFSIDRKATVPRVRRRMRAMMVAMERIAPLREVERQALPTLIRLRYLEFAWRALARRAAGEDRRPGFLKEDILALRWLRRQREALDFLRSA